jgi:hypothetical protein
LKVKRLLLLCGIGALLSVSTAAQHRKQPPSAVATKKLVLPVSPRTGRVTYYDTVRVPGAKVEALRNAAFDTYAKNFIFADHTPGVPDSAQVLKPREPAAPQEVVLLGTVMLARPGEAPVFVAGITPPEALNSYPPIKYLHFVLRMRFEPGISYLTITDLHQRTANMKQEMERKFLSYANARRGQATTAVTPPPPSTPIETLYEAWLPGYKPAPASAAKNKPATGPSQQDAQLLDHFARAVLAELRLNLARQGKSGSTERRD